MKALTIRGIDPDLEKVIKDEASKHEESLNQWVIRILKTAVGRDKPKTFPRYTDLDTMAGSWSAEEAKAFAMHTDAFATIDEELWK